MSVKKPRVQIAETDWSATIRYPTLWAVAFFHGRSTARPSSNFWVRSNSEAKVFSVGSAVRYAAARTLLGNPARADLATPVRCSAHRIRPTGGFSSAWVQCSRA